LKNKIKITLTGIGILIVLVSGCVEEKNSGSCTIDNPSGCNLSCDADPDCERTCCGCINENENCLTELSGMNVECMLAEGECKCVNGKCEFFEEKPSETPTIASSFKEINFYENGEVKSLNEQIGLAGVLATILTKLNMQANCIYSEKEVQEIKSNDKIIEAIFTNPTDITTSVFNGSKDKYPGSVVVVTDDSVVVTDDRGYEIRKKVKTTYFILEDNLGENLKGNILLGYENKKGYECWAINAKASGKPEIDKSWVEEIKKAIGESEENSNEKLHPMVIDKIRGLTHKPNISIHTKIPDVPDKMMVYKIKTPTRESVFELGKHLNMVGDVEEDEDTFYINDKEYTLKVYKASGAFKYSDISKIYSSEIPSNLPSEEEAENIAKKFLADNIWIKSDIAFDEISADTMGSLKIDPDTNKSSYVEENYRIQVIFDYKIDNFSVVGTGSDVKVIIGDNGSIIRFSSDIRYCEPWKYFKIITPDEALSILKEKGIHCSLISLTDDNGTPIMDEKGNPVFHKIKEAKLKDMYLGYYAQGITEEQKYMQPVYVFEIETDIGKNVTEYVPAIPQPNETEKLHLAGDNPRTIQAKNATSANNQFAFDLYNKFSSDEGNIFFSPYSISTALAMTYEGARGKTTEEMQSVLHFPEDDSTRRTEFAGIYNQLNKPDKDYELSTANALWAQENYKFLDDYFNTVEQYYGGKVTNLDFVGDTENSRITINSWVENQTNNKIKDLIPQGVLDEMTRLVLTNAIYFKGKWAKQFDKENTREADFKVTPGKTIKVQMMSLTGEEARFNYSETPELQILELPYDGGELSMLILLPKEGNLQTIWELLTGGNLTGWKNNLMEQEVNVYLPKFTFETKYFMKETLEEMGMPTAFSMDADFSGMDGTKNLFISDVIHQAFVEVNEEGTEAAAATAVMVKYGISKKIIFRADHPFIFIIQHKETGSILFMGRVSEPVNE